MSEIDGAVKFGNVTKGSQKIIVIGDNGEEREYSIPRGTHINVQEGDRISDGEPLMDGPLNPHDILAVKGIEDLQRYLVNAIQEVYRLQGVHINDKHIEVIVRQMLRWVRVKEVGDTEFLLEEQVDRFRFQDENARVEAEEGQPATAEPLLLGITKASLSTESFISAASFQETTRVLTEAAISGRVDYLRGLKENVIMGRLIPAGTGMEFYRRVKIANDPTMKDMTAEEMDETQSYIEQMVAAASARPVPEVVEPEMDLEDLAFGEDADDFGEVAEAEGEFALPEDEFAFESEDE
jgi:DNA-directed RNA polymerase subunit beta'